MKNRLKNIDYIVALSIVVISILTGLIQHFTSFTIVTEYLEMAGPLAFLLSTIIMYQISMNCKTEIGRHIKVICIGAAFFLLGWEHRLLNTLINLETLGLPVKFTTAFFITLAMGGLILMTYGFYMVKEEAIVIGDK